MAGAEVYGFSVGSEYEAAAPHELSARALGAGLGEKTTVHGVPMVYTARGTCRVEIRWWRVFTKSLREELLRATWYTQVE